jgi:DNA-binding NarL/FixJ family response regulator
MYRKHAPDIVFMDIHMPNMRGTNLLETLLGTLDPHAYVVMISSDTMTQTILESKAKGTRGFIMKPLTRDNLYAHVMRSPSFMPKKMH